ncbi:hypothetical protein A1355_19040 [Methylomonas koyamae]|uniref:Uncharacterized protein n=1 Tax=Methylomonas koyamae TaxID=702114 RepID=A0A177PA53_9GAMM|nr:hypothetical protein A1355_19040 [Methylomonas koyamae]
MTSVRLGNAYESKHLKFEIDSRKDLFSRTTSCSDEKLDDIKFRHTFGTNVSQTPVYQGFLGK